MLSCPSRTPPGVRELKRLIEHDEWYEVLVAPLPGYVN